MTTGNDGKTNDALVQQRATKKDEGFVGGRKSTRTSVRSRAVGVEICVRWRCTQKQKCSWTEHEARLVQPKRLTDEEDNRLEIDGRCMVVEDK
uniref:Uncharacterized protein n=1 Tax=Cucumis melo TaxID=3656 RepID=A0A9I9DHC0_CUCME